MDKDRRILFLSTSIGLSNSLLAMENNTLRAMQTPEGRKKLAKESEKEFKRTKHIAETAVKPGPDYDYGPT